MGLDRKVQRPWLPVAERKDRWSNRHDGKFYHSPAWRKVRKIYITDHPVCEECERNGYVVEAKVVDHIQSIRSGGSKLSFSNLQSLCTSCHARKSAKEK